VDREEGLARLQALGFELGDAETLWEHFDEAERRGKASHGYARIEWLEGLDRFDPRAMPIDVVTDDGYWRRDAAGTIGYIAVRTTLFRCLRAPPVHARLVVIENCFPTGMLGHYARLAAGEGFVCALTATSPARLGPPGGPKIAGTNPLAIGIPSSDGHPVVADVSMGAVTWGDVVAGHASEHELVPFGGEQWHKALALAIGLQLLVDALVSRPGHGVVLLVARPEADPVPELRSLGIRLPGDA
jgi:LDH2 family malate/lactate/ureidoglycolate dehydrogenase